MTSEALVRVDRLQILAVAALICCLVPVPTLGATAPTPADAPAWAALTGDTPFAPTNNSTIRHENPDGLDDSGDLQRLDAWLTDRLTARLRQSSLHLQRGEYDLAREYVGDEYRHLFAKYVEVEGETAGDTDRSAAFKSASETQQELIASAEQYHETHQRYVRAKRKGNTAQARALAHELESLASRVDETGTTALGETRRASNATGADLSDVEAATRSVTTNVSDLQQEVRATEFVETSLTVRTAGPTASFVEPLAVEGQLAAVNGSLLTNRTVTVQVAGRTYATTTNETGWFHVSYRPTTHRLDATETEVRYVPRNESIYLGSTATVDVAVSQVSPTIRLSTVPESVAYGASATVSGRVSVGALDAPDVPVVVTVDGRRVGTAETNATGDFAVQASIPATIPAGDRTLRVAFPLDGRALAATSEATTVSVRETPTRLSLDADATGGQANVSGRLTTDDGRALSNRRVTVQLADSSVALTTDDEGYFATLLGVPVGGRNESKVAVSATFDGEETNLASARASVTLAVAGTDGDRSPSVVGRVVRGVSSAPPAALVSVGLGLAGLGFVVLRRRSPVDADGPAPSAGQKMNETTAFETRAATQQGRPARTVAQEWLADGEPELAVRVAFAAAREHLARSFDLHPGSTHWEVYNACAGSDYAEEQRDAVRDLVVAFERATFAATDTPTEVASAAIDALARIVDEPAE